MNEAVERLKKFVDEMDRREIWHVQSTTIDDPQLEISDLKEALSLIPPYAPGEKIQVSFYNSFPSPITAEFVSRHKSNDSVWAIVDGHALPELFQFHRAIPKTVDLKGFPVDAFELAKQIIKKADAGILPEFSEETIYLGKAIVSSAREVKGE